MKTMSAVVPKTDALTELCDLLSQHPHLAGDKLAWISSRCPPRGVKRLTLSHINAVLASARFLSTAPAADVDLIRNIIGVLETLADSFNDEFWPKTYSIDAIKDFYAQFLKYLVEVTRRNPGDAAKCFSREIVHAVESSQGFYFHSAPCRAFLNALARNCPPVEAEDCERFCACLVDHWIHPSSNPQNAHSQLQSSPRELRRDSSQSLAQASSFSSSFEGSSPDAVGAETPFSTPGSKDKEDATRAVARANGAAFSGRSSLDYLALPETSSSSTQRSDVAALQEEAIDVLERQDVAFRLFAHVLEKGGVRDELVHQVRASAAKHLKSLPAFLKIRKKDWPDQGFLLKARIDTKLNVCQAAAIVHTKSLLSSDINGKATKQMIRETLLLLFDAANACIVSSWRRFQACEELFSSLLSGIVQAVVTGGSQVLRLLPLRLKTLVLMICTRADASGNSQGAMFQAVTKTCCEIISFGWDKDRSAIEAFILALASNIRERVDHSEQEDRDNQLIPVVQLNVIRLLAEIACRLKKPEVVEMILPPFIENLEEGDASTPSRLRLQLLDAVSRMAGLGFEKSYRETIVLLTRSYLVKLSTVGSEESRTLPREATSERIETLPAAFLSVAVSLTDSKLRSDYRHRLLALCSDVGLAAESKSGRSGADLLGPLLPAVAEICSDFNPIQDVDPTLLKLFRNLWFYIVLFGLAPPIQAQQPSSKLLSTTMNSLGSMSAVALHAVAGPYMWNPQWPLAVQRIAQGTPPLVVNSVKWLVDEQELNALHNPESRRGSGNEKAAIAQRAALSAALGGRVEAASMAMISGVKATYLVAVVFLEVLRFTYNGGALNISSTEPKDQSAFNCVFKYLETPDLIPAVYQCLTATVHRAFEAAISWLEERVSATGEEADKREAILSAHACFLIQNIAHRDERVRELSVNLLNLLKNRFPQVLWKSSCLDSLMFSVNKNVTPAHVIDPALLATIQSMLQKIVREWIIQSLSYAPCTTQGLLQIVPRTSSDVVSLLSEIKLVPGKIDSWNGMRTANIPAVIAAAAAASGSNLKMAEAGNLEILSTGIASANVKSNYAGEIAGMKSIYTTIGGFQPQLTMQAVVPQIFSDGGIVSQTPSNFNAQIQPQTGSFNEMLVTTYLRLLQQFVSSAEKGGIVDKASFHATCSRATALLLSDLGFNSKMNSESFSQLLRLLCWCPAYISTSEAIETGVFVWTWIVSAAPHLGSLVLAELVDAWLWTVETKRGLFASGIENSGPAAKLRPHLTPGEPTSPPEKNPVEEIIAHRIWLGFFLDRFEVIRHEGIEQLLLFGRMLQGSLKSPSNFTAHPAATGAFFTLMTLGLKFCLCQFQKNLQNCVLGFQMLEDRVYRASLGWFAFEPQWYDSDVKGLAQTEAQAVSIFINHLIMERTDLPNNVDSGSKRGQANGTILTTMIDSSHPVWGKVDNSAVTKERRKQLLLILCQHEADRLDVWASPLKELTTSKPKISSERWAEYVNTAFSVDPRIAISLSARFPAIASIRAEISSLVQQNICALRNISEALPFFVTPKAVEEDSPLLQQLPHWAPCSITRALEFFTPPFKGHLRVMAYVLRVLESYPPERVTFFMPQLVQALRYDEGKLVEGYLLKAAHRSNLFSHILIWQLQGEYPEGKDTSSSKDRSFYELLPKIKQRIIDGFTTEAKDVFVREFRFVEKVTSISGALYPIPKDQRRAGIRRELEKIELEGNDLYLPTAPNKLVRGIQLDSGIPLQSAAKVPIMITFDVVDKDGDPEQVKPQACIFKVGDDCRQDVLALQVISLLRDIFRAVGLNLYLFPYGVLPTGYERGIIELAVILDTGNSVLQSCSVYPNTHGFILTLEHDLTSTNVSRDQIISVFDARKLHKSIDKSNFRITIEISQVVPNTRSRNQMGEINDGGLYEIFQQDYGPVGSVRFEQARDNFIVSSAGYAVASLLLQPKDRHNGNLLFDNLGRLVHIDFGFILETSPGGNMRFESAQFKLSHEMTQLIDPSGAMKSETWNQFVSLAVKGYLAARRYMDGIINTVLLMKDSGLPCFSRGDPIGNLRKRFHPEMSDYEAATFMIRTCVDAYNKWTTAGYDLIQYLQQGIEK